MFVQVAEAAGLSLRLTWRVIEKADAHSARSSGIWNLSVAVNLPPRGAHRRRSSPRP